MYAELVDALPRLLAFGPLVFAGLTMFIDPAYVTQLVSSLTENIARFDRFLSTGDWFDLCAEPTQIQHSAAAKRCVRSMGLLIICLALAGLAGATQ